MVEYWAVEWVLIMAGCWVEYWASLTAEKMTAHSVATLAVSKAGQTAEMKASLWVVCWAVQWAVEKAGSLAYK